MTEKEAVKKLTQAQKSYLVKRINDIANVKIVKLGLSANYGTNRCYYNIRPVGPFANKHSIGRDVLVAIIKGTVKLRSKAEVIAALKDMTTADTNTTYINLPVSSFIDLASLEKFNEDTNKKKKAEYEAKQKRVTAVHNEADKLKDSAMLDGNLAIELLDKFEKKEF